MAKIIGRIEGYETMTAEEKLKALEALDDNADELERYKNAVSKANSEAAAWKKKHNELLGEDERKKQERDEQLQAMQHELEGLRKDKTISQLTASYIGLGYDEALAKETAEAMFGGDTAKVFANQAKFNDAYAQKIRKDELGNFPRGAGGSSGKKTESNVEQAAAMGKARAESMKASDDVFASYT